MSLTEFKENFIEHLLRFLWGKWSQLGVYGVIVGKDDAIIDPEALLVFTLDSARYDPRLFDEVLDWLIINGRWINVRRIRTILSVYSGFPTGVLAAVCDILQSSGKPNKWKLLSSYLTKYPDEKDAAGLFLTRNGGALPVVGTPDETFLKHGFKRGKLELRGMSREVPMDAPTNLVFKLRSLFGLTSRAEILAYLLTHDKAHPSGIAREIFFSQKGTQDVLVEMMASAAIESRPIGREKYYSIACPKYWWELLGFKDNPKLMWVNWVALFNDLAYIWHTINKAGFENKSPFIQSSQLKPSVGSIFKNLDNSGIQCGFLRESAYAGEDYFKTFKEDLENIWEGLMGTKELNSNITEITEDFIDALIAAKAQESASLEFKSDRYPERNGNFEIARDITAFANTEGGQIIIGIREDDDILHKTPIANSRIEAQRILQVCQSSIEPRIKGLLVQHISAGTEKAGFVVVRIPKSDDKPHMVSLEGKQEFWRRDNDIKIQMKQYEIQEMILEKEKEKSVPYSAIDVDMQERMNKRNSKTMHYMKERDKIIGDEIGQDIALSLCCTPLMPYENIIPNAQDLDRFRKDEVIPELLRHPPDDRYAGWVVGIANEVNYGKGGSKSWIAEIAGFSRLELFSEGNFEFVIRQIDGGLPPHFVYEQLDPDIIHPLSVCKFPLSFFCLAERLYDYLELTEDIFVVAKLWNIKGKGLARFVDDFGYGFGDRFKGLYNNKHKSDNPLSIGPIKFERGDFRGKNVAKTIIYGIYNAFGYDKPGLIDEEGNLIIPK